MFRASFGTALTSPPVDGSWPESAKMALVNRELTETATALPPKVTVEAEAGAKTISAIKAELDARAVSPLLVFVFIIGFCSFAIGWLRGFI
jgi:hypothetical protein